MNREARTIAIAGLTLFLFALMGYLKDGAIIFPFPLNEFIFCIVAIGFTFWHYKKGALPYLFLGSAITAVLGTVFFWELVLSAWELENFLGYTVVDWSRLASKVFLVAAAFYFIGSFRHWYTKTIFAFGLGIYLWGFVFPDLKYMFTGLLIMVITTSIKPVRQPFHLFWVLLLLLEGSKWLTFLLHL